MGRNGRRWRGARLLVLAVALLATLLPAVPAHAYTYGQRWPGREITYFNRASANATNVRQAVAAWNSSGARIRFVKASSARTAQVLIVPGTYNRANVGYPGRGRQATVILAPPVIHKGLSTKLAAHELGHILGLDHVAPDSCSVMVPVIPGGCGFPPLGQWRCRTLERDDVRRAVRLYGGSANPLRTPAVCYTTPIPPPVKQLEVVDSSTHDYALRWRNPDSRSLFQVVLNARRGSCPSGPNDTRASIWWLKTRFPGDLSPGSLVPGAVERYGAPPAFVLPGDADSVCWAAWTADLAGRFNRTPATAIVPLTG